MGEILANYLSRGLISKCYKELKKLNTPKPNNPINKCANELDSSQMKKYKCSTSLTTREMQIKTTWRVYLTPSE
jgi:hypothetical protein